MTKRFCDLCDKPAINSGPRKHLVFSRSDIGWSAPDIPVLPNAYSIFPHGTVMELTAAMQIAAPQSEGGMRNDLDLCRECTRLLLTKLLEAV